MSTLNDTPRANRLHIGIFGRTNVGKSSFINAFCGQDISIVSPVSGTTTDPVYKTMELHPLGPVVLIDTAGLEDESALGKSRQDKTQKAMEQTEVAVILASPDYEDIAFEKELLSYFNDRKIPVLTVVNMLDKNADAADKMVRQLETVGAKMVVAVSCLTGEGMKEAKEQLIRLVPEGYGEIPLIGDLVSSEDVVLLIMPQDIQAPKGRLILPQVQTIRALLDKKCIVVSATTDEMTNALKALAKPPKLIITDSQVFDYVYEHKPEESILTSFSILFAAYKGDIEYYVKSVGAIDSLDEKSRVLIVECCSHAPLAEDIGRVKIPALLKKRVGEGLSVDIVSGTDFPQELGGYDLIIQCGGCMFNRQYVLSRIERAKAAGVPMTNYGITIAHMKGILEKVYIMQR